MGKHFPGGEYDEVPRWGKQDSPDGEYDDLPNSILIFDFVFRFRFSVSFFDFDFQFRLRFRLRFSISKSVPTITFGCFDFCGVPCGALGGGSSWGVALWPESARKFLGCLPLVHSPVRRSPASSGLVVIFASEFEYKYSLPLVG